MPPGGSQDSKTRESSSWTGAEGGRQAFSALMRLRSLDVFHTVKCGVYGRRNASVVKPRRSNAPWRLSASVSSLMKQRLQLRPRCQAAVQSIKAVTYHWTGSVDANTTSLRPKTPQ